MSDALVDVRGLYPPSGFVFGLKVRYRARVMDTSRILAHVPPTGSVLDIGCGTGLILSELALRGHRGSLVGFDVSPGALALAREASRAIRARGLVPPEFRLSESVTDWPSEAFDTVCLIDVMHHVPVEAKRGFLERAMSLVAPGGTFVYKDMAMRPRWCAQANRLHDRVLSGDSISYLPLAEVRLAMAGSGLRIEREDAWRQLWYAHECIVAARPAA